MSELRIYIDQDELTIEKIRARHSQEDTLVFNLNDFDEETCTITTKMSVNRQKDTHCILFQQMWNEKLVLVYCGQKYIHVGCGSAEILYQKMGRPYVFSTSQRLTRRGLKIKIKGYIYDPFNLPSTSCSIMVDENNKQEVELQKSLKKIPKYTFLWKPSQTVFFKMDKLLYPNAIINCNIMSDWCVEGHELLHPVGCGYLRKNGDRRNYVPFQSLYYKGWALHLRKTRAGNLAFIRRPMEEIEKKLDFRIKENPLIDWAMYHLGKWKRAWSKKPVNLFYEKFASKSEEGAFDLFLKARDNTTSNNYFIIDPTSSDYEKIKNEKNVVKKWSWKYYWLLFASDHFIATEAPIHINIVRSNNKYFRKSTFEKKFIFLQHGVTYLKRHGVNSPFVSGKEATPNLMVVGSEKEKDIVSDMLGLKEEQLLVTGLPVFSNLKWESMDQNSDDLVTVMLTWKPYEEFMTDFDQTSYYQNTKAIYEALLEKLPKEKIMIIPHPKIAHLMQNTDFAQNVWDREISEALSKSKLLITDYSSVCYNSFYQGGGVVFFQPDLALYEAENGDLIPEDDEYIGHRVYDLETLKKLLDQGIHDQKIDLAFYRTPEYVDRYLTINSFVDGRNIDRIDEQLKELKIV